MQDLEGNARKFIKLRNNATIKHLHFTEEQIETAQKIIASNFQRQNKVQCIRDLLNARPCCACDDIPAVQLTYPLKGGGRLVEFYCSKCSQTVYERMYEEPKEPEKLAAYYGCQIGNIHA